MPYPSQSSRFNHPERYKLWSSSLWSLLHSPFSSLLAFLSLLPIIVTFYTGTFFYTLFVSKWLHIHCSNKVVFPQGEVPYLKDHWCQFDASMVFFLWVSVILQMFEMLGIAPRFSCLSILRAPRPLIMIRFIRVFLKFSMPKSRINQIFK